MPITVLLADDSHMMRQAIRNLLACQSEIELVGEAANFPQAIQMANDLKPQVVVMDLHMREAKHLDVKSHLNGASRLLAMSISNDEEAKDLAKSFGAVTLLDKMELYNELIPSIMRVGSANARVAAV
jgi:DNA-binding NarL/FixJ family response regulator